VKHDAQLLLGWADRTAYIRKAASDFRSRKQSDFPEWLQLQSHTRYDTWRCYIERYNQHYRIRYAMPNAAQRIWVMASCNNFAFKIATKTLEIETWSTAYRNSSSPYSTVGYHRRPPYMRRTV